MKIVIDAYQASSHITGTDRLAHNILRELQEIDHDNEYLILTNKSHDFVAGAVHAPNFKIIPMQVKKRAIWLMLFLPIRLLFLRADVFFSFHNFGSPGLRVCRTISSLLDTIPLSNPEFYFDKDSSLRKSIVTTTMKRSFSTVDTFVAISEFTKNSAVTELGIKPEKIVVNYLQADPIFFNKYTTEELEEARSKYDLPMQFVFTMGASEPRKNVAGLAKAYEALPPDMQSSYPLMIAGKKWHQREFDNQNRNIRLTGFIDDADLPKVYKLATVFAFVSKYEGFGMPVLEAMASGTPVITSTTTSLPEVAGEAAITIDPSNTEEIASALTQMLTDPQMRERYARLGYGQVGHFSWRRAAKALHELITRR